MQLRDDSGQCAGTGRGFTLIELLVVITIMALLAGLILSGINAAMRMAAKSKATAEVMSIKAGLDRYYEEYARYPNPENLPPEMMEDEKIMIMGDFANLLKGDDVNGWNPRKLEFMSFQSVDVSGNPLNPWSKADNTTDFYDEYDLYHCKFDMNFDKIINGTGAQEPEMVPENDVRKSVIVWTYRVDPETREVQEVIQSWQ